MRTPGAVCLALAVAGAIGCSRGAGPANATASNGATNAAVATRTVETANIDLPPGEPRPSSGRSTLDRVNRPPRPDADPNATPGPLQFITAPENSRIAVSMDASGVIREVRIFDGHPKLDRVETAWDGKGAKDVTITLRGGKRVRTKTNRLPDLASATTTSLLELARQ